ncbi:MAG TPA: alginate lyase family protein [Puia sp.]|jgi:hypothetical protein
MDPITVLLLAATLKKPVMTEADWAMKQAPVTVTASHCPRSAGGLHDFYSEGDYWWPNPVSADSPYIQRDGQTNPANFTSHREAMIRLSRIVGALASAYKLTGDKKYVLQALAHVRAWFVDTATMMNPDLQFAQAIKGRATGRGIGIIDTIQLMEVVEGLEAMEGANVPDVRVVARVKAWFSKYLLWLTTHRYGRDEMNAANNHGTCWVMQVAAFARFTGNGALMDLCSQRYKSVLLPGQMATDGSFPLELKRTKPYGYSLFNLDAMATICQLLSTPYNDLWHYRTQDGRSIELGIEWMYKYIADKNKWPYKHDVMHWDEWPVAQPALAFGAVAFDRRDWFKIWKRLDHNPAGEEVIRNLPVRHPLIWFDAEATKVARELSPVNVQKTMAEAAAQTRILLDSLKLQGIAGGAFSPKTIENGRLKLVTSRDWTSGFFPGELWMFYGFTKNEEWKMLAEQYTALMEKEKTNATSHDVGFKIYCSFGSGYRLARDPAYRLVNDSFYRNVIISSARTLSTRFNPKIGCIRSWDHHRDLWDYPVIIDNLMNLELLFEATRLTGDSSFYRIAVTHANTTMKNHYRPDHSSFHVVDYDTVTGQVKRKMTWQGANDSSAWARGQAWGLYAYTMCYRYTKNPVYLAQAEHIAAFILHNPHLPADKIPYWDFNASGITGTGANLAGNEPRDASAAAIMASGLYELSAYSRNAGEYRAAADIILVNLTDRYRAPAGSNKGFILLHSTGQKPTNSEVDVPINYADYYYLEALLRSQKQSIFKY